jgi:regulator of RNase E activity RraB
MSDYGWDAYLRECKGKPMLLVVDLDARADAPDKSHPWMHRMRVRFSKSDEHGFPTDAETRGLNDVEDSLLTDVNLRDLQVRYVGRITWNGARDLFFYAADKPAVKALQDRLKAALPDHKIEHTAEEDPRWETYTCLLFPNPEEFQTIMNRRVLLKMQQEGDDMQSPRELHHDVYFKDAPSREKFVNAVKGLKFRVTDERTEKTGTYCYAVRVTREERIDPNVVDDVTLDLLRRADEYGGVYDGWETTLRKAA